MSAPLVVGIDLSLTGTGVAHATRDGIVTDTLADTDRGLDRLRRIAKAVREHARTADLVVLEGPAYASVSRGFFERGGLHYMVLERLHLEGRTVVEVPPAVVKRYATGKGNAGKGAVVDAAARRYPEVDTGGDDNQADALWLAALGLGYLTTEHRVPLAHLPQYEGWPAHLRGVDAPVLL